MGNKASRRKGPVADEFTAEDIERKFENMPVLTEMEKKVLKASWRPIRQNGTKVNKGLEFRVRNVTCDSLSSQVESGVKMSNLIETVFYAVAVHNCLF